MLKTLGDGAAAIAGCGGLQNVQLSPNSGAPRFRVGVVNKNIHQARIQVAKINAEKVGAAWGPVLRPNINDADFPQSQLLTSA